MSSVQILFKYGAPYSKKIVLLVVGFYGIVSNLRYVPINVVCVLSYFFFLDVDNEMASTHPTKTLGYRHHVSLEYLGTGLARTGTGCGLSCGSSEFAAKKYDFQIV